MALLTSERTRGDYGGNIPGADQVSWYFLRISGVMLVVFALGHIFITHYMNVPSDTTFDFVSKRWANPLWRTFDWILLLMALWHGLMGLRISITDYIRSAGWRVFLYAAAWVIGIIFTAVGSITIFSFDEAAARNNTGPLADATWISDVLAGLLVLIAIVTYIAVIAVIVWVVRSLQEGRVPVYRGDIGQYAWILHRAAGIGVLFFLLIHIIDIMLIGLGRDVYDKTVDFYSNPFIIPMEIALVGALLYHSLNGIRIILIDFWGHGTRREQQMFLGALIGAIVLTIPSAIIILANEL
jgi:succinate dehydrogenase cytochrome b556 subunit/succinate dehydrogenase hydrophobic membrane anchor protein